VLLPHTADIQQPRDVLRRHLSNEGRANRLFCLDGTGKDVQISTPFESF
jgi:hypothetical protein